MASWNEDEKLEEGAAASGSPAPPGPILALSLRSGASLLRGLSSGIADLLVEDIVAFTQKN